MFWNIKKPAMIFLLLLSIGLNAQEFTNSNDILKQDEQYGIFEIGPYYPLAFGDNSANNAFDQKVGGGFSFMANLFESPFLLGFHGSFFKAEVTSQPLVGQYDRTTSFVIAPIVGYHFLRHHKWQGTIRFSAGYVRYNNRSTNFKFHDSGTSLSFTPTFSYHFTKSWGLYLSSSYRHDFLNISTSDSFNSDLNSLDYVSFSLGVRLVI
ncbi:MAG TPA: hypothetical protein VK021_04090 [Flavobacteriaceae bacterium]|nr:hypothetical protein [Flavobacteriaceae bacterium]